jgi:hypothetical protein
VRSPPIDDTNRNLVVTDIRIPFGRCVALFITWTFAAIPALIVLWLVIGVMMTLLMAVFGGVGGMRGWMMRY